MRVHLVTIYIVLWTLHIPSIHYGQNLVPNYSFEEYSSCPTSFGGGNDMDCDPWFNANTATADYYNVCSINWISDVPINYQGTQDPVTGVAYIGILAKIGPAPIGWFEYPEAQLTEPLEMGQGYHVSFYVNLGTRGCAIRHLGAYLSVGPVNAPYSTHLPYTPQIEHNGAWLNDTLDWMLIEGCFVAQGGEDHIVLGNFHSYPETETEPCDAPFPTTSYYFIDDVSVVRTTLTGLDLDLGPDVITCYEHTISPDVIDGVHYLWSDGSTGPELTVTTSGEYKLTIYDDDCNGTKDSIDVIITNQPPVAFNPADTLICSNASLMISLDPMAGAYVWNDGSTSSQYTISTAGVYSVTLDDGCDLTTDQIEVEVLDPPAAFNLGNDTILCLGTEIEFNFDPTLGDFIWQDGSQSSSIIIYDEGTYSLTISNMCGDASATVEVEELIPVYVNLGPPQTILCNNETLDIILDPTYATYQWNDGSTVFQYHISTAGVYTVTMTHICGMSFDSIVILQLPLPNVELGDSIFACPGDSLFLSMSGIIGDYAWQDGSTNDSMLVTSSDVYTLTIQNPCGMDHDSVVVEFGDLILPVHLGVDVSLCPGEQLTLFSGNPGATQVWQDGSVADSMIITQAGDYHVTVSNSCFIFSDTIHVNIGLDPPAIDLPAQLVLCEGTVTSLNPGVSGVTYFWNDGTTGSTLAIASPGTYSLTVSNACGVDVDTIEVLDGGPLPSVDIGANISLCPGDTIVVQPTFQDVDTWTWQDGSALSSFSVTDAGMIIIHVTNSCGAVADSLLTSLLDPAPILDLGVDTSLCEGESVTLSITNIGTTILWNDGSTNSTLNIQQPGSYFATVTNACGADSDTFQLSQLPAIPILDLGPDLPLCPGETITMMPGVESVEYVWQDGSTDSVYQINSAQTIWLNINNTCGTASDTLIIFSSTVGPVVDLGPDILACEGETVTINSNLSGVNFVWQDGSIASSLTTSLSGIYSVTVSNSCGADMDTIEVDIHGTAPDPDLGPDTLLCEGTSLILVSPADAETTTTWQDGSGLSTFVVNSSGTYTIYEENRCGEKWDSIIVAYQSLPDQVDLGPDTTLCPGETLLLMGPVTPDTYQWQDGSHAQSFLAEQAGVYVLSISNACGINRDSLLLHFDERVPVFPSQDHFVICSGESVILDASQSFPVTYSWSTQSTLPAITVITLGVYSITIITDCVERSNEFNVDVKLDCVSVNEIYIPNTFSPNGDGINDVFFISGNDNQIVKIHKLVVFTRWGEAVFEAMDFLPNDPAKGWDGYFKYDKMNPGVFVYLAEVVYSDGSIGHYTGDVTVMR